MKLSWNQIKAAAQGAAYMVEKDGKLEFHRFTKEQEEFYKQRSAVSYERVFATANVCLEFETDSRSLGLSVEVVPASSRRFYTHSIFAKGTRVGELSGEIPEGREEAYASGRYSLGEGWKTVKIVFPWSVATGITELTLEDGAGFAPVARKHKVLICGDSITQGYDGQKPENTYTALLLDGLGAQGLNKAIAGEVFCEAFAELLEPCEPDRIVVAYGTNDWHDCSKAQFRKECSGFLRKLRKAYTAAPIVLLSPIWRADLNDPERTWAFGEVLEFFQSLTDQIGNLTVMDCFDFVPKDTAFFSDGYLHPNDEGFSHYAGKLLERMKEPVCDPQNTGAV